MHKVTIYKDKSLMGNFSSSQSKADNARERDHQRRDRLAGYFYDLSKLSFAGLVIGVITQLLTDGGGEANLSVIITGLVLTVLSAMLANKILE